MKYLLYLAIFFSTMRSNEAVSIKTGMIIGKGGISPFRALMVIASVIILFRTLINKDRILFSRPKNRYSVQFMIAWLIYAYLSILWSVDYPMWFLHVFCLSMAVASVIFFVNTFTTRNDIIKALSALQYGIILQMLIGWYEVITRNYYFFSLTGKLVGGNEQVLVHGLLRMPLAMSGNPNNFATLMFVGIFVSWILYNLNTSKLRYLHFAVMISDAILLVMTTSRANILGLGISIVFILAAGNKDRLKYIVLTITAAIITFLTGAMLFIQEQIGFSFDSSGTSDNVRLNLIKNGLVFLWRTYGFGVGAGQSEKWMETEQIYSTYSYNHHMITNIHNWWAELMTDYGIFIFALYMFFYCGLFIKFYRVSRNKLSDSRDRVICLSLCAIMAGYILSAVSSSSNMSNESMWMFWSICITYQAILGQNIRRSSQCQASFS